MTNLRDALGHLIVELLGLPDKVTRLNDKLLDCQARINDGNIKINELHAEIQRLKKRRRSR